MKIWKFKLEITDSQTVTMPIGYEIISVQNQNEKACIWAICDDETERYSQCRIRCFGTGQEMGDFSMRKNLFIGTVQFNNGALVFHFFEEI